MHPVTLALGSGQAPLHAVWGCGAVLACGSKLSHDRGPVWLAPSSSKSESSSSAAGAATTAGAASGSAGAALLPAADAGSALPAASAVRAAWAASWPAKSSCAVLVGAALRMGLSTSPLSIFRRCLESSSGFTYMHSGPLESEMRSWPLDLSRSNGKLHTSISLSRSALEAADCTGGHQEILKRILDDCRLALAVSSSRGAIEDSHGCKHTWQAPSS